MIQYFLTKNNINFQIAKIDSDDIKLPKNYSLIRIEIKNDQENYSNSES